MIDKLKSYVTHTLGLIILVLSALLFRRTRQLENTESELARETASREVALNDQAREAARRNADELVAEYERLRDEK